MWSNISHTDKWVVKCLFYCEYCEENWYHEASCHENDFYIIGPLYGEISLLLVDSPHKWSVMMSLDGFFGVSWSKLLNKQSNCWWFKMACCSWDVIVMLLCHHRSIFRDHTIIWYLISDNILILHTFLLNIKLSTDFIVSCWLPLNKFIIIKFAKFWW